MKYRIRYFTSNKKLIDISFGLDCKRSEAIAYAKERVKKLEAETPLAAPVTYQLKREMN